MIIKVNEVYTRTFKISQEEVSRFAELTGDNNPVHLDADFAAKTMFKRPIMHGMLGACIFGTVFGTAFPGEGTIYLKQSLVFLKPMYPDTEYEAIFTIKEIISEKNRAILDTVIKDKTSGALCTTGEATIMNIERIK